MTMQIVALVVVVVLVVYTEVIHYRMNKRIKAMEEKENESDVERRKGTNILGFDGEQAYREIVQEPLQIGKTYRVNPTGSHTIDNGRGQPIQVDVTPYERPARRRAPDHDSMGPMK